MSKIVVLISILAISLAVNIYEINVKKNQQTSRLKRSKNLKLYNYTGESITPAMVSFYIKTLNDAYGLYRDNLTANAFYIQNKLEGAYTGKFEVLIFGENSTSDAQMYSVDGTSAIMWSKVNNQRPMWNYIIIILGNQIKTTIDGGYQKGSGITINQQMAIKQFIQRYQTGKVCYCLPFSIVNQLEDYDGQRWNAVCAHPNNTGGHGFTGIIYQANEQYYQTQQIGNGRCRYLLWVV